MAAANRTLPEFCSQCTGSNVATVRRHFSNNWHAVIQCADCLHQVGNALRRHTVGNLEALPEWRHHPDGEQPRATPAAPPAAAPADAERPLRERVMTLLDPWFVVRDHVPVMLREGGYGEVDVLAIPRDPRFAAFPVVVEVKNVPHATWRVGQRVKQAADYVGAVVVDSSLPPVVLAFVDLMDLPLKHEHDERVLYGAFRVAHQFRVGMLERDENGHARLRCMDDIWRERRFAETGNHWAGRALERLTNTRHRAGQRA